LRNCHNIYSASSEHSICFAVQPEAADVAKKLIEEEFALEITAHIIDKVLVERELSIIAVVGEKMRFRPGISGKLFSVMGRSGINVVAIAQGSSELNISAVISKIDELKALNVIHHTYFLPKMKIINLFMVGAGLVGAALLEQIRLKHQFYLQNDNIEIRLIGLANSRKMRFLEDGLDIDEWKNILKRSGEQANLGRFIDEMCGMGLPNTLFIDCTASNSIPEHYLKIVSSGISIATPNKIANSGSYEQYLALRDASERYGANFFYETNVGAGLPVINTLQELMKCGEKIIKIEGILSGTLSYIFNSFEGERKLSSIVKEAQQRGYTEPDPRVDLGGMDVARKLLILIREAGDGIELDDLEIEALIPVDCFNADSVEHFFSKLESYDSYFEEMKNSAAEKGNVLRYVASYENGSAKIGLTEVDSSHPLYSVKGSENIISFTTENYNECPMVIKGPGAGAEVTAAGVFTDVIRFSNLI